MEDAHVPTQRGTGLVSVAAVFDKVFGGDAKRSPLDIAALILAPASS